MKLYLTNDTSALNTNDLGKLCTYGIGNTKQKYVWDNINSYDDYQEPHLFSIRSRKKNDITNDTSAAGSTGTAESSTCSNGSSHYNVQKLVFIGADTIETIQFWGIISQ